MDLAKSNFLKNEFIPTLKNLQADTVGKWGKMNAQQMVEHVAGFFKVSTPVEHLPKYKEFLLSDKEFRENTKAPVLPDDPLPLHFTNLKEAIADLCKEVNSFYEKFEKDKGLKTQHPVFGDLNFEEWVLLHYKHVVHHLKQFGLLA
jgi:oxepin-CoA hydrolase/3-oxo-5,6-dehydrosuberyl-CoA semialdehyde dehydrogenase